MSNRTINRLREIYIQRNGGHTDFGWKDDPTANCGGSQTVFTRNPDGSITQEHYSRGERFPDKTYVNEEAVVDYYTRVFNVTEDAFE